MKFSIKIIFAGLFLLSSSVLCQHLESVPPKRPEVNAVAGDGFVKIYWDSAPESDTDSVLKKLYPQKKSKWNNFEGYKIYKATDYKFEEVNTITDGKGNAVYYEPLKVFDKLNDIEGHYKGNSGLGIPLIFTNTSNYNFENSLPPFYPDVQPREEFSQGGTSIYSQPSQGIWKLHISDFDTSKNIGQLKDWKLGFKSANSTEYTKATGILEGLNVIENPDFDQYPNNDLTNPDKWEKYQPETMLFKGEKDGEQDRRLNVRITNFWDVSSSNQIQNGDFESEKELQDWKKIYDDNAVDLNWVEGYQADSSGWLEMTVNTDSIAGVSWNLPESWQIPANDEDIWGAAIRIKTGGENIPDNAELYLELNEGVEKKVKLGKLQTDTTVFKYYRNLVNDLANVRVYVKNAQGATLYFNYIKASDAEILTHEVYQRLPRVVPGASYMWETRLYENDESIEITPGYRAYLPNEQVEEFKQHGIEDTENRDEVQTFSRSFTAPSNLRDGVFFYRVDVLADEWVDTSEFYIDSLRMTGNSKWGLNLYPRVTSEIEFENSVNWDDFQIELDIDHPWLYELNIDLESPNGEIFNLMDGEYTRSYLDGTNGIAPYLGDNSGLQYAFTDTSVNNGQRYFYAVVAFDHGDSLYNILPTECGKEIKIEDDEFVFDKNTVSAIPNPYSKGYKPPSIGNEGQIIHEGNATGEVEVNVLDPTAIKDDNQYEIYFYDSSNDPHYQPDSTVKYFLKEFRAYGIVNSTSGDTLMDYIQAVSQPSQVFEGLRVKFDNAERIQIMTDSIKWMGSDYTHPQVKTSLSDLSGHKYPCKYKIIFSDTTADSSVAYNQFPVKLKKKPADFRIVNLLNNKPVDFAIRPVSESEDYIIYPMFKDTLDSANVNFPYKTTWYVKLIFESDNFLMQQLGDIGGYQYWQDPDSTIAADRVSGFGNVPSLKFGEATKLYWEEGEAPDEANPKTVSLQVDSVANPGLYHLKVYLKASTVQEITFGTTSQDTTFSITTDYEEYIVPFEIEQADNFKISWESTGDDELWVYDLRLTEKYRYQKGDYLIVPTTVQFNRDDIYKFNTIAATENISEEESNWKNFSVVPNPYILTTSWDHPADIPGDYPNKIAFMNVPSDAVIRIFNIRGNLVRKLENTGSVFNGTINWNLKNESGKEVSYGVYVYHITSQKLGKKTGKFAIIR
jgi:subtilisin-like proprotein convertase family protein